MKKKIKILIIIAFCVYSLFFLIGSILAPIMAHFKQYDISGVLTATYMFSCHQRPERSFWIFGYPIALCCRCLGFYLGVVLSSLIAIIKKWNISFKLFCVLSVFVLIDILSNYMFKISTHNIVRFIIGIIMGFLFINLICYGFEYAKGEKDRVR